MVTLDQLLMFQPLNNGTPREEEGIIEGTLITGSHVSNNCCSRSREMVLLVDADTEDTFTQWASGTELYRPRAVLNFNQSESLIFCTYRF